jgi:two-component system response regulator
MSEEKSLPILMADDDEDDRILVEDALLESQLRIPIHFVADGRELLAYLHNEDDYADSKQFPTPGIILLDLNMPRMDGRTALAQIKNEPELRKIPIIVLTTSREETDVLCSYDKGASSYITKPANFDELVSVLKTVGSYWYDTVSLPPMVAT